MADERLREWVEEKLEQGVEPDRIKKSLRETGRDPSIVEEVRSPFDGDSSTPEPQEGEEERDQGFSFDEGGAEEGQGGEPEDAGSGKFSLPAVSLPEVGMPQPGGKAAAASVLLLVVAAAGVSWQLGLVPSGMSSSVESAAGAVSSAAGSIASSPGQQSGTCPDVGVRIKSVSSTGGDTVADVLVTGGPEEVVLEIYADGMKAGSSTKTVDGEDTITVNALGSRAVLRPAGCRSLSDSMDIG